MRPIFAKVIPMNFKIITSMSNAHVREALAIVHRRHQDRLTAFIIEGPHLIEMAIASNRTITKILVTASFLTGKEARGLLRKIRRHETPIFEVTEDILRRISDTETPQGIVAVVTSESVLINDIVIRGVPLVTVLDGVQDPGNLGTIIRTSDAVGTDAVVLLPGTCDAYMPKTLRSTAGSIFNVPVVAADMKRLLAWVQRKQMTLITTSVDAPLSVFETDLTGPAALVFGNESHGISAELKEAADLVMRIPIPGKAESLNVSSSAAVCLYEALRQRTQKKASAGSNGMTV